MPVPALSDKAQTKIDELTKALEELRWRPCTVKAGDPSGHKEEAATVRDLCGKFAEVIAAYIPTDGLASIFTDDITRAAEYAADELEAAAENYAAEMRRCQSPWSPSLEKYV